MSVYTHMHAWLHVLNVQYCTCDWTRVVGVAGLGLVAASNLPCSVNNLNLLLECVNEL